MCAPPAAASVARHGRAPLVTRAGLAHINAADRWQQRQRACHCIQAAAGKAAGGAAAGCHGALQAGRLALTSTLANVDAVSLFACKDTQAAAGFDELCVLCSSWISGPCFKAGPRACSSSNTVLPLARNASSLHSTAHIKVCTRALPPPPLPAPCRWPCCAS